MQLAKLSDILKRVPDRRIEVEGFTDNRGAEDANQILSEQRTQAVKQALVEMGVPPERIVARGRGQSVPVASNDNAAGRQLNRRVQIVVLEPGASATGASRPAAR